MELYIIRHGQSVNNALPDDQPRVQDAPLTEIGTQQADLLAQYMTDGRNRDPWVSLDTGYSYHEDQPTWGITHLLVSPMHRAMQTMRPLANALGLKPEIWIDIHEHGGIYQTVEGVVTGFPGRTRPQITEEFAGYVIPDGVTDAGWWTRADNPEPWYVAAGRAISVATELRKRAQHAREHGITERVALVTHGTFMDALVKALLNQLPTQQHFFLHYNTAITRFDFMDGDRVLMRYLNRTEHLPRHLIT
jgi:2,3-bisphosphoglycerate-dependent phosphoglycerate mutase